MSLDCELEELLGSMKEMEDRMEQQETRLHVLDAHKKTLIKALVTQRVSSHFPVHIEYNKDSQIIEVADRYPFYIFNLGKICSHELDNGAAVPLYYKVLRRFAKTSFSKGSSETVFYTTTVLSKSGGYVFLIKDDENNTWRGPNAFAEFSRSFDEPIPFRTVVEWLGLTNKHVIDLIRESCTTQPSRCGCADNNDVHRPKSI